MESIELISKSNKNHIQIKKHISDYTRQLIPSLLLAHFHHSPLFFNLKSINTLLVIMSDEIVWQAINQNFCSHRVKYVFQMSLSHNATAQRHPSSAKQITNRISQNQAWQFLSQRIQRNRSLHTPIMPPRQLPLRHRPLRP